MNQDLKNKLLISLEENLDKDEDLNQTDSKVIKASLKKDIIEDIDIPKIKFISILRGSQETFTTKRALLDYLLTIDIYIDYQMVMIVKPSAKASDLITSVFDSLILAILAKVPKETYIHLEKAKEYIFYIRKNYSLYLDPDLFPKTLFKDLKPLIESILD